MQKKESTSHPTMIDKKTQKKMKQIKREISQLQKQIKKLEFRPCRNDAELKQKAEDMKALRNKVRQLEKNTIGISWTLGR